MAIAALTITLNIGAFLTPYKSLDVVSLAFSLAAFTYTTWLVCLRVFSGVRVDRDVIYGAVCVYILLAIDFAIAFDLIAVMQSGAFAFPMVKSEGVGVPVIDTFLHTYIYFSFSTITSVGYGDIAPVTSLARYASMFEAATGQIYLSVLVARLIGLHITPHR